MFITLQMCCWKPRRYFKDKQHSKMNADKNRIFSVWLRLGSILCHYTRYTAWVSFTSIRFLVLCWSTLREWQEFGSAFSFSNLSNLEQPWTVPSIYFPGTDIKEDSLFKYNPLRKSLKSHLTQPTLSSGLPWLIELAEAPQPGCGCAFKSDQCCHL